MRSLRVPCSGCTTLQTCPDTCAQRCSLPHRNMPHLESVVSLGAALQCKQDYGEADALLFAVTGQRGATSSQFPLTGIRVLLLTLVSLFPLWAKLSVKYWNKAACWIFIICLSHKLTYSFQFPRSPCCSAQRCWYRCSREVVNPFVLPVPGAQLFQLAVGFCLSEIFLGPVTDLLPHMLSLVFLHGG